MPYLRIKSFKNKDGSTRDYLFLVEGTRIKEGKKSKSKQKVLISFGRLDKLKKDGSLESIKKFLDKLLDGKISVEQAQKFQEYEWSKKFGAIYFLENLWEKWGYKKILNNVLGKRQTEAIFCITANRLLNAKSKLGLETWVKEYYRPCWDEFEVQHFYRAMDSLMNSGDKIEIEIAKESLKRSKKGLSLVMFDTTSIMHWGEGEHAEILDYGYSKEKRGDLPQIIVGVLMTSDGVPFYHKSWQGNQSDIKSFSIVINELKQKFDIKEIIWVADRGMISAQNLELLEELKMKYIIGVKMRKLDQEMKKKLLGNSEGFKLVNNKLRVKDIKINDQRYIVCENMLEAIKEKKKREFFKEILGKKVEKETTKSFLIKNGYKKYLNIKGELEIDWSKFEAEAIYDGKWVLTTNTELSDKEIGKAYKDLWKIERGFRTLKSPLAVDPMFHWTDKRIKAHVFICFIALQIYILIKKELNKPYLNEYFRSNLPKAVRHLPGAQKRTMSVEFALNEFNKIHAIKEILDNKQTVIHLTKVSEIAKDILKTFKIKKLSFIQEQNQEDKNLASEK